MVNIETYKFNKDVVEKLKDTKFGNRWPVVYIINNKKEAYVGQTINAYIRAGQHLNNPKRVVLNLINIISDEKFNKSAILDLEAFLIKYMSADKKFILQNGNGGLQNHNYYQKDIYEKEFPDIWSRLREKGLVQNDLLTIKNSDLFKYSPYKSLTNDQYEIVIDILKTLMEDIKNRTETTFVVHGGAGTGKTILGIYLLKLLMEIQEDNINIEEEEIEDSIQDILEINKSISGLKIALVIPMDNLRKTLKKVFRNVKGLSSKMVLSPNDVAKSSEKFKLGKEGNELDWIRLQSRYQIFLYDERQRIKPTDIEKKVFKNLEKEKNTHIYSLTTQLRCLLGGQEYVEYVKEIFSNNPPIAKKNFTEYEFKIFDDVDEMVNNIKSKNEMYGLCRNVAGYAWKWNSKGKKLPMHIAEKEAINMKKNNLYDIEIDGHKYIWNSQPTDWINSENSINEIGSIHTTQGFDLNYTGLITRRS